MIRRCCTGEGGKGEGPSTLGCVGLISPSLRMRRRAYHNNSSGEGTQRRSEWGRMRVHRGW